MKDAHWIFCDTPKEVALMDVLECLVSVPFYAPLTGSTVADVSLEIESANIK